LNVVQEAYVHGVSTRKVDELVEALGMKGIDKSEVSRISKQLDEFVEEFKNRRLEGEYPYLWLDATFPKVREGGRVCSMALVIAVGVNQQGEREILGFDESTEIFDEWRKTRGEIAALIQQNKHLQDTTALTVKIMSLLKNWRNAWTVWIKLKRMKRKIL